MTARGKVARVHELYGNDANERRDLVAALEIDDFREHIGIERLPLRRRLAILGDAVAALEGEEPVALGAQLHTRGVGAVVPDGPRAATRQEPEVVEHLGRFAHETDDNRLPLTRRQGRGLLAHLERDVTAARARAARVALGAVSALAGETDDLRVDGAVAAEQRPHGQGV